MVKVTALAVVGHPFKMDDGDTGFRVNFGTCNLHYKRVGSNHLDGSDILVCLEASPRAQGSASLKLGGFLLFIQFIRL